MFYLPRIPSCGRFSPAVKKCPRPRPWENRETGANPVLLCSCNERQRPAFLKPLYEIGEGEGLRLTSKSEDLLFHIHHGLLHIIKQDEIKLPIAI